MPCASTSLGPVNQDRDKIKICERCEESFFSSHDFLEWERGEIGLQFVIRLGQLSFWACPNPKLSELRDQWKHSVGFRRQCTLAQNWRSLSDGQCARAVEHTYHPG